MDYIYSRDIKTIQNNNKIRCYQYRKYDKIDGYSKRHVKWFVPSFCANKNNLEGDALVDALHRETDVSIIALQELERQGNPHPPCRFNGALRR